MKRMFVIVAVIFVSGSATPFQPASPQTEAPQPIGGNAAIYKNLIYPEEAEETGFDGKVVIRAFIDSTGTVTKTEVLQGFPDTGLDEAVTEPVGGYAAIQRNIVYPKWGQWAGIQGTVVIQAFVDKRGYVTDTIVLKGIPDSGLNEAAIDAIRKTKFKPAKRNGTAVGVWISIPVNFRLR